MIRLKNGMRNKGGSVMKQFILGFITALIIGTWICLAVIGIISVKIAILIPVGIAIGFILAMGILSYLWDK